MSTSQIISRIERTQYMNQHLLTENNHDDPSISEGAFVAKLTESMERMDPHTYLLASPYANNRKYTYDGTVTEKFFFKYFHVAPLDEDAVKEEFLLTETGGKRVALVLGYKGSGKTTLVHWLLQGKHYIYLNFENFINGTDTIRGNIVKYICDSIENDLNSNAQNTLSSFYSLFIDNIQNKEEICRFGNEYEISELFTLLGQYADKSGGRGVFDYIMCKVMLNKLSLRQLIPFVLLWDISDAIANGNDYEHAYFFFDNLDVVESNAELTELMDQFTEFFNNIMISDDIGKIMIETYGKKDALTVYLDKYTFIFSLRETTFSRISDHIKDRAWDNRVFLDASTLYKKNEFIQKKKLFLVDEKKKSSSNNQEQIYRLEQAIGRIDELLADQYFHKNIMPLFNNDYRTIARTLIAIYGDWSDFSFALKLLTYEKTNSKEDDISRGVRYGGRCAFYRKMFDLFDEQEYLNIFDQKRVNIANVTNRNSTHQHNAYVGRLVLCYLINKANGLREKEFKLPKDAVPLDTMINDFKGVVESSVMIDTLWDMYELRKKEYWSHLITFDNLGSLDNKKLQEMVNNYLSGVAPRDSEFPKVRITCAGRMVLQDFLFRFEYYAAIAHIKSNEAQVLPPLFLCGTRKTDVKLENDGRLSQREKYLFSRVIDSAFFEAKNAYKCEKNFFSSVMRKRISQDDDSVFSLERHVKTRQYLFEGARKGVFYHNNIIFSVVGYVEQFRMYILKVYPALVEYEHIDVDYNEINKVLADDIISLLQVIIPKQQNKNNKKKGKGTRSMLREDNSFAIAQKMLEKAKKISDSPDDHETEIKG